MYYYSEPFRHYVNRPKLYDSTTQGYLPEKTDLANSYIECFSNYFLSLLCERSKCEQREDICGIFFFAAHSLAHPLAATHILASCGCSDSSAGGHVVSAAHPVA
jgi:hypothetical protein